MSMFERRGHDDNQQGAAGEGFEGTTSQAGRGEGGSIRGAVDQIDKFSAHANAGWLASFQIDSISETQAIIQCVSSCAKVSTDGEKNFRLSFEAENRGGSHGTTANRCSERMWRSCEKNAKCMAKPAQLKCMQLICAGGCAIYKLQHN
ncbi:hypothetical protein EVAR_26606_1 [Eumeta japonica]|uniref:Uncharacterized protein n=1 Tax=Eumeta variegata TaxID=151549 RepID=A0A4C1XJX3_EUMVA|nr:hypothetical protein EVAR_26606_1 [Eumeta japonica]